MTQEEITALRQLECLGCYNIWFIKYEPDKKRPMFCPYCGIKFDEWKVEEEIIQ